MPTKRTGRSVALSVLLIVAGALAIIVPPASGIAVTLLVGWLLVICGVTHVVYAWHIQHAGGGHWWGTFLGIIYFLAGLYLLLTPLAGLATLTLALAIYLFIESILEFILSYQLHPLKGSGWLLVDGIITLILAILIWRSWPSSSVWLIGTLVGISMIFSGIARLVLSGSARQMAKEC